MSDWAEGYVSDIGYTFGYYKELNPQLVKLAFLSHGLVTPEIGAACELGFGQGVSTNIHAAASDVQWHGTDFNPAQAGFAQELATTSKANANLYDEGFAEFAVRTDLPDFDYIGLHGIWSWISDENRNVIIDFIRRKLKVGGVLYISYNTLPGWANFGPMRHLLTEHTNQMGTGAGGIISRINDALLFADKIIETNPRYIQANQQVAPRFEKLKDHDRSYLAHEYFNRDWKPMYFSDMADWLSTAKLTFACSTHLLDHVDAINLTNEQQVLLNDISNTEFRQTMQDYMVNQQFRRDYWVKGARNLTMIEKSDGLRALKVVLVTPRSDVSLKVPGALGEADMNKDIYTPLFDILADYKPKTIGQIEIAVKDKGITIQQLIQAIVILTGVGQLALVQDSNVTKKAKKHTDLLNVKLMNKAKASAQINELASPITGGGIPVARFHQLFLLALKSGEKKPEDWANFVWKILNTQGQRISKEGKALESEKENIDELLTQAIEFSEKHLPVLKALQVI